MKNTASVVACLKKKTSFHFVSLHAQSVKENAGRFSLNCDEAKNLAGMQPVFLRPVQVAAAQKCLSVRLESTGRAPQ